LSARQRAKQITFNNFTTVDFEEKKNEQQISSERKKE
jgi:hypothetical protein